jgi:hypothetical protein
MKTKKCKICLESFKPERQLQKCCSIPCSIQHAKNLLAKKKAKKKKEAKKQARVALREFNNSDINILKRLAQKLFNQFIRGRDRNLSCISCGTTNDIQYHASHYKPVGGFSYLRFDENNVHKACVRCNSNLSGNLVSYRVALIEKIGIKEVERLERPNQLKRWSKEELNEIITIYRQKNKEVNK